MPKKKFFVSDVLLLFAAESSEESSEEDRCRGRIVNGRCRPRRVIMVPVPVVIGRPVLVPTGPVVANPRMGVVQAPPRPGGYAFK
jgi:hypothetical protein